MLWIKNLEENKPNRHQSTAGLWKNFGQSKIVKRRPSPSKKLSRNVKSFTSSNDLNVDIPRLKSDIKKILKRQSTAAKGKFISIHLIGVLKSRGSPQISDHSVTAEYDFIIRNILYCSDQIIKSPEFHLAMPKVTNKIISK